MSYRLLLFRHLDRPDWTAVGRHFDITPGAGFIQYGGFSFVIERERYRAQICTCPAADTKFLVYRDFFCHVIDDY
jgi:hypothetical protein